MKQSVRRRPTFSWRGRVVAALTLIAALGLLGRAVQLQYTEHDFLQAQGESRQLRTSSIPAHRGMLLDRHGQPLAISTPVASAWAQPIQLMQAKDQWPALGQLLGLSPLQLTRLLNRRKDQQFVYLRRHITPLQAERIQALDLPGVHLKTEYRRYYPMGAAAAQLIGVTDIDDRGQEGLELAYNEQLRGRPGARQVRKDRHGRIIDDLAQLKAPKHGQNLTLAIDRNLQYFAYRELERAVHAHQARSGTLVALDVHTGEVLAMAQAPSFNPNDRQHVDQMQRSNRAITDLYEPGSVIKPFTILAALYSGQFTAQDRIDTTPGYRLIAGHQVRDIRNFGELDLTGVLVKSSNVAVAEIASQLPPNLWWDILHRLGFGQSLGTGFPGEAVGVLRPVHQWSELDQASLGYGYGLSATPLHLAQAFTVLGSHGIRRPPSFLANPPPQGTEVLPPERCDEILEMLSAVTSAIGTARRANLPGYTVAAKTGTVEKMVNGEYSEGHHVAMIAGIVPAERPRLALLVLVDEPKKGGYMGGQVAAPVFQRVAWEAVRLLNVPPDRRLVDATARGVL